VLRTLNHLWCVYPARRHSTAQHSTARTQQGRQAVHVAPPHALHGGAQQLLDQPRTHSLRATGGGGVGGGGGGGGTPRAADVRAPRSALVQPRRRLRLRLRLGGRRRRIDTASSRDVRCPRRTVVNAVAVTVVVRGWRWGRGRQIDIASSRHVRCPRRTVVNALAVTVVVRGWRQLPMPRLLPRLLLLLLAALHQLVPQLELSRRSSTQPPAAGGPMLLPGRRRRRRRRLHGRSHQLLQDVLGASRHRRDSSQSCEIGLITHRPRPKQGLYQLGLPVIPLPLGGSQYGRGLPGA
jgi:hypothetical protein